MKLGFLLAILLLASCNCEAKGRPSNEKGTLLQLQPSPGPVENENASTFELFILLGAAAFPVTLICSYEVCRSIRVRPLSPRGSSLSPRAVNAPQMNHGMGVFLCTGATH
jgi:hypothetical protein